MGKSKPKKTRNPSAVRKAKGDKFVFVLDAFIYAVARNGTCVEEEHLYEPEDTWLALLLDPRDEIMKEIMLLHELESESPKFTLDEIVLLDESRAYILMEDQEGKVEVTYFTETDQAIREWTSWMDFYGIMDENWNDVENVEPSDLTTA
jgi:hypothetical protein